jgi:methionine--tRNA ligase beta chain
MRIEELNQLGLKVGEIISVQTVSGSNKLLEFIINIGEGTTRQILSGVAGVYRPETLIGKKVIVATNIDSKTMVGIKSEGMLIGIERDATGMPCLILLDKDLPAGTVIS